MVDERIVLEIFRNSYGMSQSTAKRDAEFFISEYNRLLELHAKPAVVKRIEQAVLDKKINVTYQGSTAYVRLADVYAILAAAPESAEPGLDVEGRHIEPHDCPREGPWAACDFNRYIASSPGGAS